MGKNLAVTWSMLIKGVRSCQIHYQLLDLCHLKNTKLLFCEVSLLNVKTCLNRRLFTRTTKTKVVLWQPIKLIPVINRGLNRKKMFLWAKLYCKMPQV